jgi:hypothetical protein
MIWQTFLFGGRDESVLSLHMDTRSLDTIAVLPRPSF